jgi:hypothetical protein
MVTIMRHLPGSYKHVSKIVLDRANNTYTEQVFCLQGWNMKKSLLSAAGDTRPVKFFTTSILGIRWIF